MIERPKLLHRRHIVAGLATAPLLAAAPARSAGRNLMVVYVSAKDCGPCQVFKAQDLIVWTRSVWSKNVRFIDIDAPSTTVAYQARYWPAEVRPLLAAVKVPVVPSFILADGRSVIMIGTGLGGWRNQVLPHIPGVLSGEWFRHY